MEESLVFEKRYMPDTNTFDCFLKRGEDSLEFLFGGNGDLSISIYSDKKNNSFEINKENDEIYLLFEKMFNSIANCQIVKDSPFDIEMGFESANVLNEEAKKHYLYPELFADGVITYHSDNSIYEEANILKITFDKDRYILEIICKNKDEFFSGIEVTNSGSRYDILHIPFMELYNSLCKIDPSYHQISIEEYMYVKTKKLNRG